MIDLDETKYPYLSRLIHHVLTAWPEHKRYVGQTLAARDAELMAFSEHLSSMIARLAEDFEGGMPELVADYRFLCEKIILPEELYFRRHQTYRLSKFADALEQVYANREYMARYMKGVLMSHVLWCNHTQNIHHYATRFLPQLEEKADLLEVGPGHGLLMCLAGEQPRIAKLSGWDVSETSLESARRALDKLGVTREVSLEQLNVFETPPKPEWVGRFDGIVLSEVLEHLERPLEALRALYALLKPGGKIWVNVPINSPAPDHIYLLRNAAEADDLLLKAGFEIVEAASFPQTGATLERAIKQDLTISRDVIGRRPA